MFYILLAVALIARFKRWTISGVAQDLFIALEISILPKALALPLASIASLYIVFDAMLFNQMRTRMHPSYFIFFRQASSFLDSAFALGLKKFIVFSIGIVAALIMAPTLSFSWMKMTILVILGGIGVKGSSYASNNAFFSLQLHPFRWKRTKTNVIGLPSFLIPPSEKAEYVSPMFPLLKQTLGFEGVKQFDIPIEKPPHIVFLMLESFRAKDVNARVTPCMERIKREGIYFSQFYSNGVLTHQSVISTLFGVYPFFGSLREHAIFDEPIQKVDFSTLSLIGIADLLQKKGYHTTYIDAAQSLDSEKRFFHDHGFETVTGRHDFSSKMITSWGLHDRKLIEYGVQWLEQEIPKGRPLFTVLFTVSNHHPWQTPEDYTFDRFEDVEDEVRAKFLRTMRYADHCLDLFLTSLKEKGLDQNLMLFIMGDHGQGMGEHGLERFQNSVYEENVHIPLVILAPGKIKAPLQIDTPCSQIDLFPTLMDLLHLKGLNHAMGRSLLRPAAAPLFYNNAHIGFSLGCRLGPYKYIYSDLLETKKELFDMAADLQEKHNLFGALPDIAHHYETMTHECYRFMSALYERGNFTLSAKQTLDCSNMTEVTDQKLHTLLEEMPQPHTINLSRCLSLTDHCLESILSHSVQLKHLNLTDCLISHEALDLFLKKSPHLEKVELTNCPFFSPKEIAQLKILHPHVKID